jgi:hypothetical protein
MAKSIGGWPDPARGPALGDIACGPEGGRHVAIRRTRQGRGDDPGPGLPSAAVDPIDSGSEGRRGASAASYSVMVQAAPYRSGRERLVRADALNCIPRAKGRERFMVLVARADPLNE